MSEEPIDLLQIKIEKAKAQLSEDAKNSINAVDWKAAVLGMREKKGYSFEQLENLEIETELVLCGLLSPENYPKELENRMHLSKIEVNDLIKEMNFLVFTKIKENLIKNYEEKKVFTNDTETTEIEEKNNTKILNSAGIEIIPPPVEGQAWDRDPSLKNEVFNSPRPNPLLKGEGEKTPPILAQKLSGYVKNEITETDHSLNNLTQNNTPSTKPTKPAIDPYREIPE